MARDTKKDVKDYNLVYFVRCLEQKIANMPDGRKKNSYIKKISNIKNTSQKWGNGVLVSANTLDNFQPKQRKAILNIVEEILFNSVLYCYDDKQRDFQKVYVQSTNNNIFLEITNFDVIYINDYEYMDVLDRQEYGDKGIPIYHDENTINKISNKEVKISKKIAPRINICEDDGYKKYNYFEKNKGFTKEFFEFVLKIYVNKKTFYDKLDYFTFSGLFKEIDSYVNKIQTLKQYCDLVCDYKDYSMFYN